MKVHLIKEQTIFQKLVGSFKIGRLEYSPIRPIRTFGFIDVLGNGCSRMVFNVGGNHYRILCKYHFGKKQVHLFVCRIGTHAAYDKICKEKKQYTINVY